MKAVVLSVVMLALASMASAVADDRRTGGRIVLQLVEEAWAETQTARVAIMLKILLTDDSASGATVEPTTLLDQVAAGDWRVSSFHREQTDTGFEQWVIVAEARLPQSALTGIYERVKQASERGRSLSVLEIDFTPSLAEQEATAAALRAAIYARAAAEAAAVADVFPDRDFRVHRVSFNDPQPRPVPMEARALRSMAADAQPTPDGGGGPPVSERLVMQATVVIAADKEDKDKDD